MTLCRHILATLCYARTVIGIIMFQNTATYTHYPSYSIDTQVNFTTMLLNFQMPDLCAYRCTIAANCFAATYLQSGMCLLQENCGHVVLKKNSSGYTFVKASLSVLRKQAELDFPFIKACGYFTQYGNGSLSTSPFVNVAGYTGDMKNSMNTAPVTFMFTRAKSGAMALTDFIRYEDTSAPYSLDLFSSGTSFSMAFYYISTSTSVSQAIFTLVSGPDTKNCFVALHSACNSTQCLTFRYFPDCNGYNVSATWTVSLPTGTNKWSHVAFVYDSSVQRLYGYVNSSVVSTQSVTSSPATAIAKYMHYGNGRNVSFSFQGSVFGLRLYRSALSRSEVEALYQEAIYGTVFAP